MCLYLFESFYWKNHSISIEECNTFFSNWMGNILVPNVPYFFQINSIFLTELRKSHLEKNKTVNIFFFPRQLDFHICYSEILFVLLNFKMKWDCWLWGCWGKSSKLFPCFRFNENLKKYNILYVRQKLWTESDIKKVVGR